MKTSECHGLAAPARLRRAHHRHPYTGIALTDRLSVWAAAGEPPLTVDISMRMVAAGLRSKVLKPAGAAGLALAVKGDTRFTQTASEATKTGGSLAASEAEVRVRLDGGDAETGFGADMGGGLAFADPKNGLKFDVKARGLISHRVSGFRAAGRLQGEIGYGLPVFGGDFTGAPNLRFGISDGGARDCRNGWRLTSAIKDDPGSEVSFDATRREAESDNAAPEREAMLKAMVRR